MVYSFSLCCARLLLHISSWHRAIDDAAFAALFKLVLNKMFLFQPENGKHILEFRIWASCFFFCKEWTDTPLALSCSWTNERTNASWTSGHGEKTHKGTKEKPSSENVSNSRWKLYTIYLCVYGAWCTCIRCIVYSIFPRCARFLLHLLWREGRGLE